MAIEEEEENDNNFVLVEVLSLRFLCLRDMMSFVWVCGAMNSLARLLDGSKVSWARAVERSQRYLAWYPT